MTDINPLTIPRRTEWPGPAGWAIWADEDGLHIRTPKGDSLEMPEALRLIETYQAIATALDGGTLPKPAAPTREQRVAMTYEDQQRFEARRAAGAVYAHLTHGLDNPDVPF